MNNDLISRSALLDGLRAPLDYLSLYLIRKIVNGEPAVDAVEVVRCKDCVWYQPNWIMGQDVCGKIMHDALRVSPNFFCQRGERKEDNNGKDN